MFATYPAVVFLIFVLLLFGVTSGLLLQQKGRPPITSTYDVFFRQKQSFLLVQNNKRSRSLLWASSSSVTEDEEEDHDQTTTQPTWDWDEQFKELQMFMSEYGHCNFPTRNPSPQLEQKYPSLKSFCRDQRKEYKLLLKNKWKKCRAMSLLMFDRDVCFRQLNALGFEFNPRSAQWYDNYQELIQYQTDNGHMRVTEEDNPSLLHWMYDQRSRRRNKESKESSYANSFTISDSQIKLLDDIGFEWRSELGDELWNTTYQELVAFRNQHGHLMTETNGPLDKWICHQRRRRAGAKGLTGLTEKQIRLLDEIEFPWKPVKYESKWYMMYEELKKFQKKHGHCQPTKGSKLFSWSVYQHKNHRQGRLSAQQTKLLEKIDFPFKRKRFEWNKMYRALIEYSSTHGHLPVNNQDDDGDHELYEWMDLQRQRYHGIAKPAMTQAQIEKLEDNHFCWSLDWRDRTWHEKYTEAAEFFKEHDHVRVTKKENPSLYNWIQMQAKRYKEMKGQKPLSEEELEMLEQIDFPFLEGQLRVAWNEMYTKVSSYREEHDGWFPLQHKDDPELNRWMRQQRHRYRSAYGYVPLSDEQKILLDSIDFPIYPLTTDKRTWYEKYDELVDFQKQHGHCLGDSKENDSLYKWILRQRVRGTNTTSTTSFPLSKSERYLLERIGFAWTSNHDEIGWQSVYDEVVKFLEVHGRFPKKPDDPKLARWVYDQRLRYKGHRPPFELSEYQIQQLEKIGLFLW